MAVVHIWYWDLVIWIGNLYTKDAWKCSSTETYCSLFVYFIRVNTSLSCVYAEYQLVGSTKYHSSNLPRVHTDEQGEGLLFSTSVVIPSKVDLAHVEAWWTLWLQPGPPRLFFEHFRILLGSSTQHHFWRLFTFVCVCTIHSQLCTGHMSSTAV